MTLQNASPPPSPWTLREAIGDTARPAFARAGDDKPCTLHDEAADAFAPHLGEFLVSLEFPGAGQHAITDRKEWRARKDSNL